MTSTSSPAPRAADQVPSEPSASRGDTGHADVRALQQLVLRRCSTSLWRHLPVLAISGAATGAAIVVALILVPWPHPLVPIATAIIAGPTVLPLMSAVRDALVDDDTDLRGWLRTAPRLALRGLGCAALAGLSSSALFASLRLYETTASAAAIPSIVASACMSVATVAGLAVALPCAAARPGLPMRRVWIIALHLIGRWPVRCLAPVAAAGLAVWIASAIPSALVILLPAPVALVAGGAYWCCAVELGAPDLATDAPANTPEH